MACFEVAGDDIAESVTQELLGDYIVAVKLAKHLQVCWPALFTNEYFQYLFDLKIFDLPDIDHCTFQKTAPRFNEIRK